MNVREKLRVAVLISGRGSNMEAIASACAHDLINARIVRVIADRTTATGVQAAARLGLSAAVIDRTLYSDRDEHEAAVGNVIADSGAELVALAGYMRILSTPFVERYAGRMLNIHPSLLPRYKGLHTHRRVLQAGDREHGASVHFVSIDLDAGAIICQARVPVLPGDTEDTLSARVLAREHRIYPMAIGLIAEGRVRLQGDRVFLDGRPLTQPLMDSEAAATASHGDA